MTTRTLALCALATIFLSANPTLAQKGVRCDPPDDFDGWLNCEVYKVVQARLNQNNSGKQAEAPSVAGNSTTFVDQTSAADLVSVAYNLAGLATKDDSNGTAATVTTTAYALYAAAAEQDPLNPRFYNAGRNWRRVSLTLGQEFPDDDRSKRADIYGLKILLQDRRDASNWIGELGPINGALGASGVVFAKLSSQLQDYLFQTAGPRLGLTTTDRAAQVTFINETLTNKTRFTAVLDSLKETELQKISKTIEDNIAPFLATTEEIRKFVNRKKSAPQFSVAVLTKQRKGALTDEHRVELIYDQGLFGSPFSVVANASYEYRDAKTIGADVRGARGAAELKWRITSNELLTGGNPWTLSLAAEGTGFTNSLPSWKVQGKVHITIPALNGLELPLSVTWASRTSLINESKVRSRVGFTFDFARLIQGLK